MRRALHAGFHFRVLWRSPGTSAEGKLLGPCESHWATFRVRRSQALCRGYDHGLSALPRREHTYTSHLQYLRSAAAAERWPRDLELHETSASRRTAHGLRRRHPDTQLLLRQRPDRGYPAAGRLRDPRSVQHRASGWIYDPGGCPFSAKENPLAKLHSLPAASPGLSTAA